MNDVKRITQREARGYGRIGLAGFGDCPEKGRTGDEVVGLIATVGDKLVFADRNGAEYDRDSARDTVGFVTRPFATEAEAEAFLRGLTEAGLREWGTY